MKFPLLTVTPLIVPPFPEAHVPGLVGERNVIELVDEEVNIQVPLNPVAVVTPAITIGVPFEKAVVNVPPTVTV